ncbi:imidazole glycerol phosphate synthase subunit HisH [Ferrimonas sp. SCSIO 43195]|uniref:imidazole glycerol phosphate synthase subunit HisH n=1 Tax=Ferrimonas sp. SCSIO 43195 TaxID=2822844 RepID=UPI002075C8CC|nr:imidazole glycerol phosphate synthase subunit HisH [Ferrimonas sp. SCSIO 43195]USD39202.1 imidazole glycerol phosphate synthase subunit HisH [Ferrimonas sp. SCSIO 43195]
MSQSQPKRVTIIDTGCANLSSVRFALLRLGAEVTVSRDPAQILASDRVILPGVGSAPAGIQALRDSGVLETLGQLTQPVLGICLGMQLLGQSSDEGQARLTGLLPFRCRKLKADGHPLPHMGWNTISPGDHPLFADIADGSHLYFVHSYAVAESELTLARCHYGQTFSAAVGRGNLMGVQFHPERSGPVGAKILQNFLEMPS